MGHDTRCACNATGYTLVLLEHRSLNVQLETARFVIEAHCAIVGEITAHMSLNERGPLRRLRPDNNHDNIAVARSQLSLIIGSRASISRLHIPTEFVLLACQLSVSKEASLRTTGRYVSAGHSTVYPLARFDSVRMRAFGSEHEVGTTPPRFHCIARVSPLLYKFLKHIDPTTPTFVW